MNVFRMNLLNGLSSSVELPDLAFNNFLLFSTWAYKDDIQATEDAEWPGYCEKVGAGSRSCHRNRWHVSTHPSASLGCIPVFAAEDKGIKRGEVKWLGMKLGNRQSLTVEALWPDFLQSLPAACLLLLLYSLHPHQVYNLFYFLLSKTLLDQLSYTSQYFRTRWRVRVINKGQHFRSLIYRYGIWDPNVDGLQVYFPVGQSLTWDWVSWSQMMLNSSEN